MLKSVVAQICVIRVFQVYDTSNINSIDIREVCILCHRHAYGRSMGEKSSVYLLFGAHQWPCALVFIYALLHSYLPVSFLQMIFPLKNTIVWTSVADLLYRNQELWCATALDPWAVWDLPQLQNSCFRLCTLQKDNFQHEWTFSRCYTWWAQCVSYLISLVLFHFIHWWPCLWLDSFVYLGVMRHV
jgi:hypothetical protein